MSQAIVETADPRIARNSNELIERVAKEATARFGKCYIRSRSLDNGKVQWWIDKRGRIAFAAQSFARVALFMLRVQLEQQRARVEALYLAADES